VDALCCEAGPRFCKGDSETLDPDVRAFLRYVDGKAAKGKFMKAVEDEVMRVKEHKETRREYMTYAMEIKRRELASFAEGEKKKETMMILAMLRKGFSVESIAECAQTSVEYILELGKKNHLL
jgi:SOS response regulatory protein OraA/RecX